MSKEILPLDNLSISELFDTGTSKTFEVPIYQRNYAWEIDEISALVQDVYDAYTKPVASDKQINENHNISDYYIGTLVTYDKGNHIYEVIDGQQRLTTICLILYALNVQVRNILTYRARKKSNLTLESLSKQSDTPDMKQRDDNEKDNGILSGYKNAAKILKDIIPDEKERRGFADYFQDNVRIIHYRVPKDIDLNHYFEIMNSRGEQLEKHEIVKAQLLRVLKDNKVAYRKFSHIWDACSDMHVYIQQEYNTVIKDAKQWFNDENPLDFNNDIFALGIADKLENDNNIKDNGDGNIKKVMKESYSLHELISGVSYDKKSNQVKELSEKFVPIIDFPNFLLIVLKLTLITGSDRGKDFDLMKFVMDDKELIREFSKVRDKLDEEFVIDFGHNLLKAKYFLDNCIVHHAIEEDHKPNNPWELKYFTGAENVKFSDLISPRDGNDYNSDEDNNFSREVSCDNQKEYDNRKEFEKLRQLLSMFEVSFTPRQRKNYLFYCLLYLFTAKDRTIGNYRRFMSALAKKYLFDVYLNEEHLTSNNTPKPDSFDRVIIKQNQDNPVNDYTDFINIEQTNHNLQNDRVFGSKLTTPTGEIQYTTSSGTPPLFIFNCLDYEIWNKYHDNLRGMNTNKDSPERKEFFKTLKCSDFGLKIFRQFYFSRTRRSLEHFYPQARSIDSATSENSHSLTREQIECFGNYAMIGAEANSAASDRLPIDKVNQFMSVIRNADNEEDADVKQVSVASLKFIIMMQKCRDNDTDPHNNQPSALKWNADDISEHQEKMIEMLIGKQGSIN